MSYGFSVRAGSKAAALALANAKLDEIAGEQPVHVHDRAATDSTLADCLALLGDDPALDVSLSISGSIIKSYDEPVRQVTVSVSAALVQPLPAEPA